ncbi:hypothetical protein BJF80_09275 [Serinicoccus sp. CUA-874]|nr:hypothetical protein BJF80_09275 [Serinicoccus sp. CUA-874]
MDTSVLVEILKVPGKSQRHGELKAEFDKRYRRGDNFVIPVTTLIETGNHISQCQGDRRAAANRFVELIQAAHGNSPPWLVRGLNWDACLLEQLIKGDSTGSTLFELLAAGRMGAGDVAILVERDAFRRETAYDDVRVWTLEAELSSFETPS